MGLKKNNPGCQCCEETPPYSDCPVCPDTDGPTNGISFAISGFTNQAFSRCNCPDYDATYAVPNTVDCAGAGQYDGCYDAPTSTYEALFLGWVLEGATTPYDWQCKLNIKLQQDNQYPVRAYGTSVNVGEATYVVKFTNTTHCYEMASDSMTYLADLYEAAASCTNLDGLTISATSY